MRFGDESPEQWEQPRSFIEPIGGPSVSCEPCGWRGNTNIRATHIVVVDSDEDEGAFYATCEPCARYLGERLARNEQGSQSRAV